MHWECFSFFDSCRSIAVDSTNNLTILDIGSYDINGSLKYLFPNSDYTGIDLSEGPNVDIVVSGDEFITDKRYDIVLSCECFEHNPKYLQTLHNMMLLTKENGLVIFTCATTGRAVHGTKDTSPFSSIASQNVSSNYYKNLTASDFEVIGLDDFFSSYSFYENPYSHDLYFIGRKHSAKHNDSLPRVDLVPGVSEILEASKELSHIKNNLTPFNHQEMNKIVDGILSNYPLSNLLLTRLMQQVMRMSDYDKVIRLGDQALSYSFNQAANLVLQAKCHFKKGNLEFAYELMTKVSNLPQIMNPKNVVFMAGIENKLFGTDVALNSIKKTLDIFPNEKEPIWRLYIWSKKVGNTKEAELALLRMKELYPDDKRLLT